MIVMAAEVPPPTLEEIEASKREVWAKRTRTEWLRSQGYSERLDVRVFPRDVPVLVPESLWNETQY
jgi:hypothetical protein